MRFLQRGKRNRREIIAHDAAFVVLDHIELAADATIDFQDIPAGYRHLKIIASVRADNAATESEGRLRINNDSGANYDGNWGHTLGVAEEDQAPAAIVYADLGQLVADSAPAQNFTALEITLPDYADTGKYKALMVSLAGARGTAAGDQRSGYAGAIWKSTAAINRLMLWHGVGGGALKAGSVATLYGLR